ncbi:MAG TPA: DNA mismatch repair endonuclease MutL [Spirochaetota bacterium]|nr:DNA mismatch repair endonuclease MutL [Spirochaetota bacterium]
MAGMQDRIMLLDPLVSARIAAGEVVEQPASVVRELVDNAIDAGATSISIELTDGGLTAIRVVDNGSGMGAADLARSVLKHATSKIRSLEDLDRVTSMGFRGEALFAIASVSRLRLVSNPGDGGHEIIVDNGKVGEVRAAAAPQGTIVEVTGLFRDIPARRAFMKAPASEARTVRKILAEKMLAWPEIRFVLTSDGSDLVRSAGGDLVSRISDLYDSDLASSLLPLEHQEGEFGITGYLAPVHRNSASRRDQYCSINGRPVFLPAFSRAVATAYGNQLAPGRYAIVFMSITIPPSRINVNVHPAKREVRICDEGALFSAIVHAVRHALGATVRFSGVVRSGRETEIGVEQPLLHEAGGVAETGLEWTRPVAGSQPDERQANREWPEVVHQKNEDAEIASSGMFAGVRIIGCYADNYWLYEQAGQLYMIDQHAAHERVLYERFAAEYRSRGITRQGLLVPVQFVPGAGERDVLEGHADEIAAAGFSVAPFGPKAWILDEQPADVRDGLEALRSLLAALADPAGSAARGDARLEKMLATLACHAAVRRGDRISPELVGSILQALARVDRPFSCPHGRPSIIAIKLEEIETWFARR